ncbi:preprotein translocase subunit SecY [Enterobacterales bacterium endosymbiont of Anomoneura mori]|uniref:preprotein translocase subunit SecY n=1 Tax=Enterobacterales bacterium endosymbiont of Anomoneura mori TaxID=3132096 RepID=UPI00399CD44E
MKTEKIKNIFKNYNNKFFYLKNKILFLICILIIFRIGNFIPIPGFNIYFINDFLLKNNNFNIFENFNIFLKNNINNFSIFFLGLTPYISSTIIVQIINFIYPNFKKKYKNSYNINNKINQFIRYLTFIISLIQSIIILLNLNKFIFLKNFVIYNNFLLNLIILISLVTGSMLLMWLGEKINENGIGNGISIIICLGILFNIPISINNIFQEQLKNLIFLKIILYIFLLFLFVLFIIFIECSQRRISVNYKSNQIKNKFYTLQNIYLPLKINIAGITPVIFSTSFVLFLINLISFLLIKFNNLILIKNIILYLKPGKLIYVLLYINFILIFNFLNISLFFNSKETANNLKKSNAYIYGIRPGIKTEKYINNIISRLNILGSIYIIIVCLFPEIFKIFNISLYLNGTSILIVTLVIMEFISQIQSLLMSNQYNSVIKKTNLKC